MNIQSRFLLLAILSLGAWSEVLLAESGETERDGEAERDYEVNTAGVFVGMTGAGRRENGFTVALVYERRFSESFGLSLEAERVYGDLDFWVVTVPLDFHYQSWKFFAGPGLEIADDAGNEWLMRVGGEYAFEGGRWEIAPTLAVDFVDSDKEIIGGLGFLYGF